MANSGRAENKDQASSLFVVLEGDTYLISIKRLDDGNTVLCFRTKLSFYSV